MKVRGFTLIELMITLLIGSILLAWGIPNYRDFKMRREVVDNANEFVYSLNLARAEAVRYGTQVDVDPTGGAWNQGWTITAIGVGGNSDTIIQQHGPVRNMTIDLTTNPGNGVTFNRIGGLQGNAVALFDVEHTSDSSQSRIIRIGMSGTVKVIQP